MLKLKFSSILNDPSVVTATDDYLNIWGKDRSKIVASMEKISGLSFQQKEISVIIYEGISFSGDEDLPMKLRASYSLDEKKGTLIHELGHRLIEQIKERPADLDEHLILFLILYDIWAELYGQDFADEMVNIESSRKGYYDYKSCWANVLKLSRDERLNRFNSIKGLNGQ